MRVIAGNNKHHGGVAREMAKTESKIHFTGRIDVVAKNGSIKGHIDLTAGNFLYYRQGAKDATWRGTYQTLFSNIERSIELDSVNVGRFSLPAPHEDGDLAIHVDAPEYGDFPIVSRTASWKQLDKFRMGVDCGSYQFDSNILDKKKQDGCSWFVHVSVQAALWIVDRYIKEHLKERRLSGFTDKDVVVSKAEMRKVVMYFLKLLNE